MLDRSPLAVVQPLSKDAPLIHAIQPFPEASIIYIYKNSNTKPELPYISRPISYDFIVFFLFAFFWAYL